MSRSVVPIAAALTALAVPVSVAVAASPTTVNVSLANFKVKPAKSKVKAGKVTFVVKNPDSTEHELVVIKTKLKASKLPVKNDIASERGKVGAADDIAGGKTKRVTLTLKAGHYALICNLEGHYQGGMYADFDVTK